jgi:putative spermidine/putrescine transport system ATP-binding protein
MNMQPTLMEGMALEGATPRGALIDFLNVSKTYGPVIALHPTSLRIEAGEFFAIIGPSGSGKTTLLAITAGFVAPSAGRIEVNGTDIVSTPPYHRNFGMVFQNYALFPHMTVEENIAFPLKMRGLPKQDIADKVARALDMVRLKNFGGRRPVQLSGGQAQRVALARAAVYDPVILLMDEPLGALDKNLREEMQDEIKRLQREMGSTVIYVTHDQQEAANMADRLAIMRNGRLEQIGTPRELYEQPETIFAASFLGEASILPIRNLKHLGEKRVSGELAAGLPVVGIHLGREAAVDTLCLRPERIKLGAEAEGADNVYTATVEDAVYTTGSVRYRLSIKGSSGVLISRTPTHPDMVLLKRGDETRIGWNLRDGILLKGE